MNDHDVYTQLRENGRKFRTSQTVVVAKYMSEAKPRQVWIITTLATGKGSVYGVEMSETDRKGKWYSTVIVEETITKIDGVNVTRDKMFRPLGFIETYQT